MLCVPKLYETAAKSLSFLVAAVAIASAPPAFSMKVLNNTESDAYDFHFKFKKGCQVFIGVTLVPCNPKPATPQDGGSWEGGYPDDSIVDEIFWKGDKPVKPGQTLDIPGFERKTNSYLGNTISKAWWTDKDGGRLSPDAKVPEPASWLMMILGFGLVGVAIRRGRLAVAGYAVD